MIIEKLILIGEKKKYNVKFKEGLNIIYGDSDTGKSSILELIDYCLGSKNIGLYKEIEENCTCVFLEIKIQKDSFLFKRNLFEKNDFIEVYSYFNFEKFENSKEKIYPKIFSADSKKEAPSGWISDYLLDILGIPRVKLKFSPNKDNSKLQRLSFRNIMHYIYVNQDDLGSKNFLSNDNYMKRTINIQTLKFIYKVLNSQITELQEDIKEQSDRIRDNKNNLKSIASFFKESKIDEYNVLLEKREILKSKIEELKKVKKDIDDKIINETEFLSFLRNQLKEYSNEIFTLNNLEIKTEMDISEFKSLMYNYEEELKKIKFAIISPEIKLKEKIKCPLCSSEIKKDFSENYDLKSNDFLNENRKKIQDKLKFLKELLVEKIIEKEDINFKKEKLEKELEKLEEEVTYKSSKFITPFLTQIEIMNNQLNKFLNLESQNNQNLSLREKEINLMKDIENFEKQLKLKKNSLEELGKNYIQEEEVKKSLKEKIEIILKNIKVEKIYGINIGKDYLPEFRGNKYSQTSSGGIRTILSFAYLLSILKDTNEKNLYKPPILMIDSIGKFLGTKAIEDSENLKDPTKIKNIYAEMAKECSCVKNKEQDIQIIVVDNDPPPKEYEKFVIKRFSSLNKAGYEIGLINDYGL